MGKLQTFDKSVIIGVFMFFFLRRIERILFWLCMTEQIIAWASWMCMTVHQAVALGRLETQKKDDGGGGSSSGQVHSSSSTSYIHNVYGGSHLKSNPPESLTWRSTPMREIEDLFVYIPSSGWATSCGIYRVTWARQLINRQKNVSSFLPNQKGRTK